MAAFTLKATALLSLLCSAVLANPIPEANIPEPYELLPREVIEIGNTLNSTAGFVPRGLDGRDLAERDDDRVLLSNKQYPFSAIGRLLTTYKDGRIGWCTGTLVGRRIVLTASHCVPTEQVKSIKFQPAYDGKEVYTGAYVQRYIRPSQTVTRTESCSCKDDWTVYILDAPLGTARGWLGTSTIGSAPKNVHYNHLGYPKDKNGQQTFQDDINLLSSNTCDQYGPLRTDADGVQGTSGGPLWLRFGTVDRKVYGVASRGRVVPPYDILCFGSGLNMVNSVARAQIDYP